MTATPNDLTGLEPLLTAAQGRIALVVGDVMLDRYISGTVTRRAPEGTAPVLDITDRREMPGGAGNVALNLHAAGMAVRLAGCAGTGADAQALAALLEAEGIGTQGLITAPARPATVKTRFVADGRLLLRADSETRADLDAAEARQLLDRVDEALDRAAIVILSDYGKGVLSPPAIAAIMARAHRRGIPVLADPKKKDPAAYRGAFLLTPNRDELGRMTGLPCGTQAEVETAAARLMENADLTHLVVTCSEDGMAVFGKDAPPVRIAAETGAPVDVSGAGDTVIAWLAAALAGGADLLQAARLANRAAGLAVRRRGAAAVTAAELRAALPAPPPEEREESARDNANEGPGRIAAWDAAAAQVAAWRRLGLRVGFTNGCFDILHYGHVGYLARARERCDRLVVGLNRDRSVRLLKGPQRPLHDERSRAAVLAALAAVDLVVLFGAEREGEDNTPCALLEKLRPDLFFKGGDYTRDRLPETAVMDRLGGAVEIMPLYEGHSTTATIEKIGKNGS